jgi:hypothetical protein
MLRLEKKGKEKIEKDGFWKIPAGLGDGNRASVFWIFYSTKFPDQVQEVRKKHF